MKKWFDGLKCILAFGLLGLLIWQWPQVHAWNEKNHHQPDYEAEILRIWVCAKEDVMSRIHTEAAEFEKHSRETRVAVRRVPEGEWLLEGCVLPDVLILGGAKDEAVGFSKFEGTVQEISVFVKERENRQKRIERREEFCDLLTRPQEMKKDA